MDSLPAQAQLRVPQPGNNQPTVPGFSLVAGLASLCFVCMLGCETASHTVEPAAKRIPAAPLSLEMESRIERFCGDCHSLPLPDSFARDRWHFEIRRGYEFYAKSGRTDLEVPAFRHTLAYYRERAPEQLSFPTAEEAAGPVPVTFRKEGLHIDSGVGVLPEIAHLQWAKLAVNEDPVLIACDMRYGHVVAIDPRPVNRKPPQLLAQLRNPSRAELCDLDGDGTTDLVVADLGSYLPAEHDRGRVVLLRREVGKDAFETIELATGLGRVADVRAGDVDDDGRMDLIVAEFGWRETGRLLLLRNITAADAPLQFEQVLLDDRPGTIDVRLHDFSGDGRPDLATVLSQELEEINLLLNRGDGRFARHNLWAAPDLTFGSTGIELADVDGNGEMDIVYTNGDTFDNDYATPWHGVQWLENRGGLQFTHRRLTDMPGAYRAVPGDFDGDGRLDIVVVARLSPKLRPLNLLESPLASVVLLHQDDAGSFHRHTLEWDTPFYAAVAAGDFDGDGDLDFAVGSGPYVSEVKPDAPYLTIWWNEGDKKDQ